MAVRVSLWQKWPYSLHDLKKFGIIVRNAPEEELFNIQEGQVTIPRETYQDFFPKRCMFTTR